MLFGFQESSKYLQNELESLEREQQQIDEQAAYLEKKLRKIMESGKFLLEIIVRARQNCLLNVDF